MAANKPAYGSSPDGPFIDNPNAPDSTDQPVTTGTNPQPQPENPPDAEKRLDEGVAGGRYQVDNRIVDANGFAIKDGA